MSDFLYRDVEVIAFSVIKTCTLFALKIKYYTCILAEQNTHGFLRYMHSGGQSCHLDLLWSSRISLILVTLTKVSWSYWWIWLKIVSFIYLKHSFHEHETWILVTPEGLVTRHGRWHSPVQVCWICEAMILGSYELWVYVQRSVSSISFISLQWQFGYYDLWFWKGPKKPQSYIHPLVT